MKLALQATNIFFEGPKHAGVSRSSLQLLEAILTHTEHSYVVFVKPEANYPSRWDDLKHVKVVRITKRTRLWKWFLHDLEPLLHRCRYWFSVSGEVPRFPFIKKASLIHDIFFHTYADTYTEEDRVIHERMYANISRFSTILFSNSNSTADQFAKHYHYPRNRIHPLPFGVGQVANPAEPLTEEDRKEIALPAGEYILCVSTMEPRKNFPRLFEAFNRVANHPSLQNVQLVIVGGKGWNTSDLITNSQASEVADRITFLGYISDELLVKLYKSAKYAVTPSLEEGFGMPVLEALHYGCPVCSSNTGALQEIGGDLPIYFDPLDVEGMANALIEAAERPNQSSLISEGKAHAENFGWDLCADIVLSRFSQLAAE